RPDVSRSRPNCRVPPSAAPVAVRNVLRLNSDGCAYLSMALLLRARRLSTTPCLVYERGPDRSEDAAGHGAVGVGESSPQNEQAHGFPSCRRCSLAHNTAHHSWGIKHG